MDGIILINKETGITSFGVVSKVRRIFNIKKVGHCGTLDPEATGVLPVMIGQATKLSKYLVEHDKEYIARVKLGIKTDTADSEGNVIEEDNFILNAEKEAFYKETISKLVGKQKQIPPMYSAIKVNGKKLYEYARDGIEIARAARDIEIYSIDIEHINYDGNEIVFRTKCSKGTYIRALCESLAEAIGTIGYMKELTRTQVDNFRIEDSIKLSELENVDDKESKVISIERLFENSSEIILNDRKIELFLNGVMLTTDCENGVYRIYNDSKFIGLGVVNDSLLKRDIIV
jgi:tRNA pseudouridine55 synthase